MRSYTLDELGDWAVTYYLDLQIVEGVTQPISELRSIENFISYLKRDA